MIALQNLFPKVHGWLWLRSLVMERTISSLISMVTFTLGLISTTEFADGMVLALGPVLMMLSLLRMTFRVRCQLQLIHPCLCLTQSPSNGAPLWTALTLATILFFPTESSGITTNMGILCIQKTQIVWLLGSIWQQSHLAQQQTSPRHAANALDKGQLLLIRNALVAQTEAETQDQ